MSDHKNDTRNQTTGNEMKKSTVVGFSKTEPKTIDPSKKERVPNERVPNIGDPKKKPSIEDSNAKKIVPIKDEHCDPCDDNKKDTPEHKEKSKHDQATNADVKITNQHESDQKFNNSRF